MNQPIGGSDPVPSEAALIFPPNTNVSAIDVSVTEEYTVAFVGTNNGYIVKVSEQFRITASVCVRARGRACGCVVVCACVCVCVCVC